MAMSRDIELRFSQIGASNPAIHETIQRINATYQAAVAVLVDLIPVDNREFSLMLTKIEEAHDLAVKCALRHQDQTTQQYIAARQAVDQNAAQYDAEQAARIAQAQATTREGNVAPEEGGTITPGIEAGAQPATVEQPVGQPATAPFIPAPTAPTGPSTGQPVHPSQPGFMPQ